MQVGGAALEKAEREVACLSNLGVCLLVLRNKFFLVWGERRERLFY